MHGENWKKVDETKLSAWIGFFLRAGLDHNKFRPVDKPFGIKTGTPFYRASMRRNKFK